MDEDYWKLPLNQRQRYRGPRKSLTHDFTLEPDRVNFILRRNTGETAAIFPAAEQKLARYLFEVLINNGIKADKLRKEINSLQPPTRNDVPITWRDHKKTS